jgi:phage terminase large subunit
MKITLKNGAIWQLVGSDYYDSLVGSNPFGIVMSEAALSDPRAWSMFRPILAGNDGWAMHISTPRGYNHFHDIIQLAKKGNGWHHSHLTALQTGHIRPEVLAQEQAEMPDELFRQEYMCDFSAANVGAIFGRYIEQAEKEGRIVLLEPDRQAEVWVTSDIGYRDKAAFIYFRRRRGGFEAFMYDDATGLDAQEWIDRLRGHGQRIDVLVLPHDARAKTFQSSYTVVEQFLDSKLAGEVRVNPIRKKQDSINAGRMLLRKTLIDPVACEALLQALRAYSFKYDEATKTFSSEPNHDWSSHAADAWQEAGACLQELVTKEPERKIIVPPLDRSFSLNGLWDTVGPVTSDRL